MRTLGRSAPSSLEEIRRALERRGHSRDTAGPGHRGSVPSSERLRTNTSSFSDLFHLITSCDFLGTMHRNEQEAASGHNRITLRVQLHSPPHRQESHGQPIQDGFGEGLPRLPIFWVQRCPKSPHRLGPAPQLRTSDLLPGIPILCPPFNVRGSAG